MSKMRVTMCFSCFRRNRVAPAESQNRRHLSDVTNWREPAVKDFQEEMSKVSSSKRDVDGVADLVTEWLLAWLFGWTFVG